MVKKSNNKKILIASGLGLAGLYFLKESGILDDLFGGGGSPGGSGELGGTDTFEEPFDFGFGGLADPNFGDEGLTGFGDDFDTGAGQTFDSQQFDFRGGLGAAGLLGTSIFSNIAGRQLGKQVAKRIDRRYLPTELPSNKLKRFVKDPYGISAEVAAAEQQAAKTSSKIAAGVSEEASEKFVKKSIQEAPSYVKGLRRFANVLPFGLDVPVGASIDVYFTKDDPKPITWADAFAAAGTGETAQLGVTAAGAGAGTIVPGAGTAAGAVVGQIAGISADIAATEAYYYARGYDDTLVSALVGESYAGATPEELQTSETQTLQSEELPGITAQSSTNENVNVLTRFDEDFTPNTTQTRGQQNVSTALSSVEGQTERRLNFFERLRQRANQVRDARVKRQEARRKAAEAARRAAEQIKRRGGGSSRVRYKRSSKPTGIEIITKQSRANRTPFGF